MRSCRKLTSARGRSARRQDLSLECLESRRVFSVAFAFAGIQYPASEGGIAAVVFGEGTRAEDGSVTGTQRRVTATGESGSGAIDIATMMFDGHGGMMLTDVGGVGSVAPFGADFRMTSGYPIGFFSSLPGVTAGDTGKVDRFFIEKRDYALVWTFSYRLNITRLTTEGMGNATLDVTFEFEHALDTPWPVSNPIGVKLSYDGGAAVQRGIVSITDDGVMTLDSGEMMAFSNNSNPYEVEPIYREFVHAASATDVLYVDMNADDGVVAVGVGSVHQGGRLAGAVGGVYRGSIIADSATLRTYLGAIPSMAGNISVEFVLVLSESGGYEFYRPEDYAATNKTVLRTGTWTLSGTSDITLTDPDRAVTISFRASSSRAWTAWLASENGGDAENITGVLSRFAGTLAEKYGEAREVFVDSAGHAQVFMWIADLKGNSPGEVWTRVDLTERAGGRQLRSSHITVHPMTLVATATPYTEIVSGIDVLGHVVIYERSGGNWRLRDLTEELGVAEIGQDSTIFDVWKFDATHQYDGIHSSVLGQHQIPVVYGKDVEGHHVLFKPEDGYNNDTRQAWERVNLSQSLADGGVGEPDFTGGSITGFTSPWGSINVIGLDASGQVEALWTSPGFGWYVNNLTSAAGSTLSMRGGLAPYFTTWHALNVPGLDDQGHVEVLWWTPQTGRWIASDLTETYSLAPMAANQERVVSISNYDYRAMAIGGFDTEGHVVMYWWVVGQDGWQARDVVDDDAGSLAFEHLIKGDVRGRTALFTTDQSVWGTDENGDIVRTRWHDSAPDEWRFENVTELAIPNG